MTEAGPGESVATPGTYDPTFECDGAGIEREHSGSPEIGADQPGQPAEEADVDLRPLKRAVRYLAERDPVRQLIEGEPDALPFRVLAAKADSWVLLLLRRGD